MLSYYFSLGLYFDHESGDDMCFRIFGSHSEDYMPLHSGRLIKQQGMKLTTQFQPVPESRKCGSIQPFPNTPSWRWDYIVKHRDNFAFFIGKPREKNRDD
jgi:hypothetical protein